MSIRAVRRSVRSIAVMLALAVVASSCTVFIRVSTDGTNAQWTAGTNVWDVSGPARHVLIDTAEALDPIDTNGVRDIYRKDTRTGDLLLVSKRNGVVGNDRSVRGEISDDGRWIVYETYASNLVPGDTNGRIDVVMYDAATDATVRASVDENGNQSNRDATEPAISGNGRFAVFHTDAPLAASDGNGVHDVYRFDRVTGDVEIVSESLFGQEGNGSSFRGSVSADGSVVAFESHASNLVLTDTNAERDVFIKIFGGPLDDAVLPVSRTPAGVEANGDSGNPSVSGNGLVVAFDSLATNLVPGDTNGEQDVFVWVFPGTAMFRASIADDDVTQGSARSSRPHMNGDGTVVVFTTQAPELHGMAGGLVVPVVRDGVENRTVVPSAAAPNGGGAGAARISNDGNYVVMDSNSSLITPDANGSASDVFLTFWSDAQATAITPSTVPVGTTQSITLTGSGFPRHTVVSLWTPGAATDGVSFSNVTVVDHETITADMTTIAGTTALGPKNVIVQAFGTGPGLIYGSGDMCTACVTVVP